MQKDQSPAEVLRQLQREAAEFQPAILGSLSLRRAPCIHKNCQACRSGEQHQSHVLYARAKGRRFAVYVPQDLVGEVQRCLDNGRALQELLHEAGPRYLGALKDARKGASDDGR